VGYVDADGLAAQSPDEDTMAAPRSGARSRMYDLRRPPPSGPEEWEREFYDPDPTGTRFRDGMRGTHVAEVSPVGRLADIAVQSVRGAVDVAGTLAGLGVRGLVGPNGRNLHFLLDLGGLVPGPVGIAADLLNAGFYALQGDTKNMALSAVSAIGGIVDALKAKKFLEEGMVLMLTGGSTKLTARGARAQGDFSPLRASEGAASPVPKSYMNERDIVDMEPGRGLPRSTLNTAGEVRNADYFWRQLLARNPDMFSKSNRYRIEELELSPRVDATWLKYHAAHQSFKGEILHHHHIDQGRFAVPLPQTVHEKWTSVLHAGTK